MRLLYSGCTVPVADLGGKRGDQRMRRVDEDIVTILVDERTVIAELELVRPIDGQPHLEHGPNTNEAFHS